MHSLKRSVERSGGVVPIPKSYVQNLAALLQFKGGLGEFSSSDVLSERDACDVGEHPLEVVG